MNPAEVIRGFDGYLAQRGLSLDAVIIGGTALNLLGVVSRPTRDCDILEPRLSAEVSEAAKAFAAEIRQQGATLDDHWFNDSPSSLADVLSAGWRDRLQLAFRGKALTLRTLGRLDLLCSKLFALCDRGIDLPDCVAMQPVLQELKEAEPWLLLQDLNPDWPAHVHETLADLARRLGYEL